MAVCSLLKFKLLKDENIKEIILDTNVTDWKEYRKSLSTFQKSINDFLSELVEDEKLSEEKNIIEIEVDEDVECSSSEDEKSNKRVISSPNSLEKHKIHKV